MKNVTLNMKNVTINMKNVGTISKGDSQWWAWAQVGRRWRSHKMWVLADLSYTLKQPNHNEQSTRGSIQIWSKSWIRSDFHFHFWTVLWHSVHKKNQLWSFKPTLNMFFPNIWWPVLMPRAPLSSACCQAVAVWMTSAWCQAMDAKS